MEFSKYIVPIFLDENYYGTGFIVNGMLITANHVVMNKLHTYFVYEGKRYHVDINKLVVLEPIGKILPSNQALDLFVCKTDIESSNLSLS